MKKNIRILPSLFDRHIDDLLLICEELSIYHGVLRLEIDFPNSRLICWHNDNPSDNIRFSGNEVFDSEITAWFGRTRPAHQNTIPKDLVWTVLKEFKRLRQDNIDSLQQASINCANGQIGMAFQSSRRIVNFEEFFASVRGANTQQTPSLCKRI